MDHLGENITKITHTISTNYQTDTGSSVDTYVCTCLTTMVVLQLHVHQHQNAFWTMTTNSLVMYIPLEAAN